MNFMKANESLLVSTAKVIFIDWVGELLYFPLWWYSRGLRRAARWWFFSMRSVNVRLGLTIWLKNIAVPMYGQYDWQGRLISFFMRFVMIVFKLIGFVILSAINTMIALLWIITPPLVVYEIFIHVGAFFRL